MLTSISCVLLFKNVNNNEDLTMEFLLLIGFLCVFLLLLLIAGGFCKLLVSISDTKKKNSQYKNAMVGSVLKPKVKI